MCAERTELRQDSPQRVPGFSEENTVENVHPKRFCTNFERDVSLMSR